DAVLNAGDTLSRSGSFVDPGTQDTWNATVDYGDGSGTQPLSLVDQDFNLSHTYGQSGTFPVTVKVTDDDGGGGTPTLLVTVTNGGPTSTVVGDQHVQTLQSVKLAPLGTSVYPNFGPAEVFTFSINWGDGTPTDQGTATITTPGGPGQPTAGAFNGS